MDKIPFLISFVIIIGAFLSPVDGIADEKDPYVNYPNMELQVEVVSTKGIIKGMCSARLERETAYSLSTGFAKINSITLGSDSLTLPEKGGHIRIAPLKREAPLYITFETKIPQNAQAKEMSHDSAVLLGNWFPKFDNPAIYHLTAKVKKGLTAVSEADTVYHKILDNEEYFSFQFNHPREELSLVVGRYRVKKDAVDGIEIASYFFDEDIELADRYLEKTKGYIKRYKKLFGFYPFERFAIVENRAPTGYGMATYTLLGQQVIRLPFIVDTSLGHEIVHSWFGNSVYTDYSQGNWCEGIVTYLADHLYKEEKGEGVRYRHEILADYQSYVHKSNAIPLSQFRMRTDRPSKAVGYGNGTMLFHMLRNQIGPEHFEEGLRLLAKNYLYKKAGWKEVRTVFEQISEKDLSLFFDQWLNRKDVPVLGLKQASSPKSDGSGYETTFTITQLTDKPYVITVPYVIRSVSGKKTNGFAHTDKKTVTVRVHTEEKPKKIILDPKYDLMRQLTKPEYPPILSRLFGAEKKLLYVSKESRPIGALFEQTLFDLGFKKLSQDDLTLETLQSSSLLVVGSSPLKIAHLDDTSKWDQKGVLVHVKENPFSRDEVIAFMKASSGQELSKIASKLIHYGNYDKLLFKDGKIINKQRPRSQYGVSLEIEEPSFLALPSQNLTPMENIVRSIKGKRVIFVGERHDQFGHHKAQLKVIEELYNQGISLAVGMEMFQRPFQGVLDKYLNGEIDERTFLKKSEYFTRWGYDYHLYRPIINFCKEKGIPVIALNLPAEISKKVARQGLKSLTDKEQKAIPDDIDWSNEAYRQRLKQIFDQHEQSRLQKFDYFYQAQLLWDETMAESIHNYLKNNPKKSMVVLAGVGHIAYGQGIPDRTQRRGQYSQAILVNLSGEQPEPGMADYFLFPPDLTPPFSARLGISLEKDEKLGLVIRRIMPGSVADKAGLKPGDIILKFNQDTVSTYDDLKIALFFIRKGDTAEITVKRIKRFRPDKTLRLRIGPFMPGPMTSSVSPHGK